MLLLRACATAALLLLCAGARLATAADGPVLAIKQASVGFGGKYKAGFWQPVLITVRAGERGASGRLEVIAPDGDQTPVVYRDDERGRLELAADQEQTVVLYAKSGPIDSRFSLQLVTDGVLWEQQIPSSALALASTDEFLVGLGPELGLSESIAALRHRETGASAAMINSSAGLPDRWWGYSGVDLLVLATSDTAFIRSLSDDQRRAIVDWVRLGGRLILSCGERGEDIAAQESPWAPLIPGELSEVEPLRDRMGLENYTKVELPFNDPVFQRNRPLVMRLKNVRGEVLLDEQGSAAGRPLIIRAPVGLGQVTFVALDLDHPALKDWKGRTRLLASLLARRDADRERGEQEAHRSVAHLGYDDLIGQLRSAMDNFGSVAVVNFTTVSLLITGYLLLAAAGDYLLLSRLKLPRHWTWFTFPLLIVATVAGAAVVGRQGHGARMRLNQVDVVDIDLAQQVARGTMWAHVYSPSTASVSAALAIQAPGSLGAESPQGWLTWHGLPGDSLGGLESRQPPLVERAAYAMNVPGGEPLIQDLVIPIASAKSLSGRWWANTKVEFQSKLTLDRYGLLAGEFVLPLDVPLEECLLAHGEKLYRIGALAPGQRVALSEFPPLDLEARLTQRRIEQSKDVATPWDKATTDVPRIVQMIMFHEAARGRSYTGLSHRYQPELDLSEHVRLGRAVLVGRAKESGVRLVDPVTAEPLVDETESTSYTWYRLLFPVAPRQVTPDN